MIKDLMKLRNQIDSIIITYRDLHPDECFSNEQMDEKVKTEAFKKIRAGKYEISFSKKQG